jgi:conjugal transfer pilus assembly protein TraW
MEDVFMKILLKTVFFSILNYVSFAGFEGNYGHLFSIDEEDILSNIEDKLKTWEKTGALEDLKKALIKKTIQKMKRPTPVQGLKKTLTERSWTFDPSLVFSKDLQDHNGKVFYKAATKLNPLTVVSLSKTILFLDGDDPKQVIWAEEQEKKQKRTLWVLVKGSPFLLFKDHRSVFFDQQGVLVKKLGISQIPASVNQEGMLLRITEHVLQEVEK